MSRTAFQSLEFTRGDDESLIITFDQDVADFTSMKFTIREIWATDETDNTGAIYSGTPVASGARTATLTVPKATTVAMLFDEYVHDVEVVAAGINSTTQRGPVRMTPDVGR